MIFKTAVDYSKLITPIINNITTNIINDLPIENNYDKNSLLGKLENGKIKYTGNYFMGYFDNRIQLELSKLGAIKSSRGYYLPEEKLTQEIKTILKKNKKNVNQTKDKILNYLSNLSLTTMFLVPAIAFLCKRVFFDLNKEFNTKSKIEEFKKEITALLNRGVGETIKNTIKFINDKEFANKTDLINMTRNNINYFIKEKTLNTISEALFNIQKDECLKEGQRFFYWWHVPEKKPSDRSYHRAHFEASKKGKKFDFLNLPTWNGQPDYPAKLWNCRCRAYVDRKQFLKNI